MKREILKSTQGITLIALIITIIVMIILVGVTVTTALDTKLFQQAQEATQNTQIAKDEESKIAEGKIKVGNSWVDINDYVSGLGGATGGATIDFSAKNVGDKVSEYTAGGLDWRVSAKNTTTTTLVAFAEIDTSTVSSDSELQTYIENNFKDTNYKWQIASIGAGDYDDLGLNVVSSWGGLDTVNETDVSNVHATFGIDLTDICLVTYIGSSHYGKYLEEIARYYAESDYYGYGYFIASGWMYQPVGVLVKVTLNNS